jgi:hypothetical protein
MWLVGNFLANIRRARYVERAEELMLAAARGDFPASHAWGRRIAARVQQ